MRFGRMSTDEAAAARKDLGAAASGANADITGLALNGGTVAAPSYSFAGNTGMGIFLVSAGVLGVAVGGAEGARFSSIGLGLMLGGRAQNLPLEVGGSTTTQTGGLSNMQAFFGIGGAGYGGVVLGSGVNGNSPTVAASRDASGNPLPLMFYVDGAEKGRFDRSGLLTVGGVVSSTQLSGLQFIQGFFGGAGSTYGGVALGAGVNANTPTVAASADGSGNALPLVFATGGTYRYHVTAGGDFAPWVDNGYAIGTPAKRPSIIFSATGSINTSDAREKTAVAPLSPAEIAASRDLAREIGTFSFLSAVAAKGGKARRHVGMTVQRAIAIMQARGLDPFVYGFICHDSWPATPDVPEVLAKPAIIGRDGTLVSAEIIAQAPMAGTPAGDRYGFRVDELLLFVARGMDARISALEAATPSRAL